jgi:prephenate dehydrogenase
VRVLKKNRKIIMKVTIVGMGLIGGSLSLALRECGLATLITGVDDNREHAFQALHLGLADEVRPLGEALQADVVFLCIPVNAIEKTLPGILDQLLPEAVVIDFGSTKESICEAVKSHKRRGQYVAAHPIAGTENEGPAAAVKGLFRDKTCIVCEKEESGEKALQLAEKVLKAIGMKIVHMDARAHDLHLAYVSHLSHVLSFALAKTVLTAEKDHEGLLSMAGSGFASTARLAKSGPQMWTPIFLKNNTNVLGALDSYIGELKNFRELLQQGDAEGLFGFIEEANVLRTVLKEKK